MRSFKNLGLRNKLLILVLTSTIIVLALTIVYFSISVRENTLIEAKKLSDSETEKYANKIKGMFDKILECTNSLSKTFVETKYIESSVRDSVNKKILYDVLSDEEDYIALWLVYEIKALDSGYTKKHGRINYTAANLSNKLSYSIAIKDTTNDELTDAYSMIKKDKKQLVFGPYEDEISKDLKGVLMVSSITPLIENGSFCGVIGVDVSLDKIQNLVQEINPFNESSAYLVAPNNMLVSHTDKEMFKKDLYDVNKKYKNDFEEALSKLKQNVSTSFEIQKKGNSQDVYVSIAPIKLGEDGKVWAMVIETPLNLLTAKSDKLFFITLLAGFIGLAILSVLLYYILNKITKNIMTVVDFSQKNKFWRPSFTNNHKKKR